MKCKKILNHPELSGTFRNHLEPTREKNEIYQLDQAKKLCTIQMALPAATIRGNYSREIRGSMYHSPTAYASATISVHDTVIHFEKKNSYKLRWPPKRQL